MESLLPVMIRRSFHARALYRPAQIRPPVEGRVQDGDNVYFGNGKGLRVLAVDRRGDGLYLTVRSFQDPRLRG